MDKCHAPGGKCVGSPACDGAACPYDPAEGAEVIALDRARGLDSANQVAEGAAPRQGIARIVEVRGELWAIPIKGATAEGVAAAGAEGGAPAALFAALDLHHDLIVSLATALLALNDPRVDRVLRSFAVQIKGKDGGVLWPK